MNLRFGKALVVCTGSMLLCRGFFSFLADLRPSSAQARHLCLGPATVVVDPKNGELQIGDFLGPEPQPAGSCEWLHPFFLCPKNKPFPPPTKQALGFDS